MRLLIIFMSLFITRLVLNLLVPEKQKTRDGVENDEGMKEEQLADDSEISEGGTKYQIRMNKETRLFLRRCGIVVLLLSVVSLAAYFLDPPQTRTEQIYAYCIFALSIPAVFFILYPEFLKIDVDGDEMHIRKWFGKEYHLYFSEIQKYKTGKGYVTIYQDGRKLCKVTRIYSNMNRFKTQIRNHKKQ